MRSYNVNQIVEILSRSENMENCLNSSQAEKLIRMINDAMNYAYEDGQNIVANSGEKSQQAYKGILEYIKLITKE